MSIRRNKIVGKNYLMILVICIKTPLLFLPESVNLPSVMWHATNQPIIANQCHRCSLWLTQCVFHCANYVLAEELLVQSAISSSIFTPLSQLCENSNPPIMRAIRELRVPRKVPSPSHPSSGKIEMGFLISHPARELCANANNSPAMVLLISYIAAR